MSTQRMKTAVLLVVAAGVAACAGRSAGEASAEAAAPALSDPEIAHIAVTANAIDVEAARLAQSRASDESVLAFAETMIEDHTSVNEQAAALAERLGVTPRNNAVSRQLRSGADDARSRLETLRGAAFDRAYMEREVAYHRAVLNALDDTLIPGASNADLRGLLEQVRPAIAAHLDRARSILDSLGSGR